MVFLFKGVDHLLFTFIILAISIFGCRQETVNEDSSAVLLPEVLKPESELSVGFLVVDGVYNSELVAPMDIFHHTVFHTDPGMRVFVVAPEEKIITTFEGLKIVPDYSFDNAPGIDVLVVPSAEHSMDSDLENKALISFVAETGRSARYIMSLCDGAFVLAKAGLTNGFESTTFPSDISRYRTMYPQLTVHENVSFVHDSRMITSAGGAKSYDPALYLVELLYGRQVAVGVAKGLVIDWDLRSIKHVIVPRR